MSVSHFDAAAVFLSFSLHNVVQRAATSELKHHKIPREDSSHITVFGDISKEKCSELVFSIFWLICYFTSRKSNFSNVETWQTAEYEWIGYDKQEHK